MKSSYDLAVGLCQEYFNGVIDGRKCTVLIMLIKNLIDKTHNDAVNECAKIVHRGYCKQCGNPNSFDDMCGQILKIQRTNRSRCVCRKLIQQMDKTK
jgi:hypothetical protein